MDPNQVIRSAVARVKHTSTRNGREALGLFSLEGTRAVERALRANTPLDQVIVAQSLADNPSEREQVLLAHLEQQAIQTVTLPNHEMQALTNGRDLGQVIGLAPLPGEAELPAEGLFVVAVDIADPGNLGGMIRTSLASGASGMICVGNSDPWHPKAVRTSMGSLFKLPVFQRDIEQAEKMPGVKIATSTAIDAVPLPELPAHKITDTTFLFMGSEAFGLPETLLPHMDTHVRIPMVEGVDSFSVNVATGIALYQLLQPG